MYSSSNNSKNTQYPLAYYAISKISLSLCLSSLGCSLPIAPDHDHTQEASNNRAAEKKEDDRDANGPDAGREEGLDEVGVVDEGLFCNLSLCYDVSQVLVPCSLRYLGLLLLASLGQYVP